MRYTVVLIPGEKPGRYVAYVPAIPGCVTQGDSFEEALDMAEDAAAAMIADMIEHRENIPHENPGAVVASVGVTGAVEPALLGAWVDAGAIGLDLSTEP